ncbi:MAG: glycosyltransferase family 1 protein [Methanocorpusculum sp.]|uniref:glycosyltransferase family 4 protein n=1 Tax=Methanocorpusculum sp. TaxID=2058474 RepID=UPI00271D04DD|nr:glycosyltransferase family 1 protein [Methanocorpusculum sp.]MDO9523364.1 glycosyltransferase family 1 protein [Methanocorpusculum sp.]
MKVLYDYQAFLRTKYGGVPRYFSELIQCYNVEDIEPIVPRGYCRNEDYRNLYFSERKPVNWRLRDSIVDMMYSHFHVSPAKYLSGIKRLSLSQIKKGDFDIFHPTSFDSYFLEYIGKKPYVLTIYDLTYDIYPEFFPLSTDVRANMHVLVENATHLIAISECTKNDLVTYYNVDPDCIDVVYLGSLFERYLISPTLSLDESNNKYLLYVGERGGYKNFYHFVNAIHPILQANLCELVCVGGGQFSGDEVKFLKSLGILHKVHQEFVSNEKLISLYQHAVAFVYPSLNEGFGLPTLEAFSCGCPVICSNTSCFPEVGGDAVIYFEPKSAESIRKAVYRVLYDNKLRNNMISDGYKQLNNFSWNKCAEETKRVYLKVLDSK